MASSIWSAVRMAPKINGDTENNGGDGRAAKEAPSSDHRSAFQVDYDRLLFSTPVRRLSDKTQVWPLEKNDGVRTRLTHSHEVANLARSIGTSICKENESVFDSADLHEDIQPLLSAIGLAHDLGNPPFGHRGEVAISRWFEHRKKWIFTHEKDGGSTLSDVVPDKLRNEFLKFDGNPQTLRLITKLQTSVANVGLGLTASTLASLIKYPVSASNCDSANPIAKKMGYFESECEVVDWVRGETGLGEGQRHPLTWIMEACDDIAYSVLDIDDAMKKGVLSPDDVFALLSQHDGVPPSLKKKIDDSFRKVAAQKDRSEVARDIKIGYLRAHLIQALIDEATKSYIDNSSDILKYDHKNPLLDSSELCRVLKRITRRNVLAHPSVLKMEVFGTAAIHDLMDFFWLAISDREDKSDILSDRIHPMARYGYSLMSSNYVEAAVLSANARAPANNLRYRELRLLTDMISGMADAYTVDLRDSLKALC